MPSSAQPSSTSVPGCAFCRIVSADAPAHVVLSQPEVLGFLDARPVFPGHVLVVPRRHVGTLPDLPAGLLVPLFDAVRQVAAAVVPALDADGSFVAVNNVVSQSVPHLHVHVVPRRRKDGLRGFFWPRQRYADEAEAAAIAERLRRVLSDPFAANRGASAGSGPSTEQARAAERAADQQREQQRRLDR